MQSAFLIVSKHYKEKQAGVLFFVFGMAQFLFQTPSGYIMDYTNRKILVLCSAAIATTCLTVFTAYYATDYAGNFFLMVIVKFLQGAVTSLIPPGLNSITQGIVGAVGMTKQVSVNEMMNHLGTSIIVIIGSVTAFLLYPDMGILFIVSPIACLGVLFFLNRIRPEAIDHAAARGLKMESSTGDGDGKSSDIPVAQPYKPPPTASTTKQDPIQTFPSFNIGFGGSKTVKSSSDGVVVVPNDEVKADTPLKVLRDPTLITFLLIVFLFHTANGTVLPLVMQSLAIGNGGTGMLMSGLCIIVAQIFMVASAKICGDYSGKYGRKGLFLTGFFSLPIRCLILVALIHIRGDGTGSFWMQLAILSTQFLDGIGAGVFGTMYILVTSDISGGSGRFSLTLGLTTAAMSIGGTVSGYLGQALAEDLGYQKAFFILMIMSLVPAFLYLLCMPETLPALVNRKDMEVGGVQMAQIKEEEDQQAGAAATSSKANYVEMY